MVSEFHVGGSSLIVAFYYFGWLKSDFCKIMFSRFSVAAILLLSVNRMFWNKILLLSIKMFFKSSQKHCCFPDTFKTFPSLASEKTIGEEIFRTQSLLV